MRQAEGAGVGIDEIPEFREDGPDRRFNVIGRRRDTIPDDPDQIGTFLY